MQALRTILHAFPLLLLALFAETTRGQNKTFNLTEGTITLNDVSATTEVYYQSMRYNSVQQQWNFELVLRNTAAQTLSAPVVVLITDYSNTGGPVSVDGRDETGAGFWNISSQLPVDGLPTGAESRSKTMAVIKSGTSFPLLHVKVYAPGTVSGPATALARAVDEVGHPLGSVHIGDVSGGGAEVGITDSTSGLATLTADASEKVYSFAAPGYVPVWRRQTLAPGSIRIVPSARMAKIDSREFTVPVSGGSISNVTGTVVLNIPAHAFTASVQASVTALGGQTLPAYLPQGWSPLGAFWLDLSQPPSSPVGLQLQLTDGLQRGEMGLLAWWDQTTTQWIAQRTVVGVGANLINSFVDKAGGWALIVADSGTPGIVPGQPVTGVSFSPNYAQLSANATVAPGSSPASTNPDLVTARARVVISTSDALPSGTLLRGDLSERYDLRDGTRRVLPPIESYFAVYKRPSPGDSASLSGDLLLQPKILFGADELVAAALTLDVYRPGTFGGALFTANGGTLTNGLVAITAAAGAFANAQAVQLTVLNPTNFYGLISQGKAVAAFNLLLGAEASKPLQVQVGNLAANASYVLARVISQQGVYGLEPVERFTTGTSGGLISAEPPNGPRLNGLTQSAQYVLVQLTEQPVLLGGIARNASGQPASELLVRSADWITFSRAGGSFVILSRIGSVQLQLKDLANANSGVLPVDVPAGGKFDLILSASAQGPVVLSVTPSNGATNVPIITSIVLEMSKALNPGTLAGDAVQLFDPIGTRVDAAFTLNLKGTTISLLPTNPLTNSAEYRIFLASTVADVGGTPISGDRQFTFTTAPTAFVRNPGAQLTSYEPTNGLVKMEGSQGLAEPGRPAILVNETSGRTFTVMAGPDGSFHGEIAAEVDDRLSVTLVNGNGTTNTVSVSEQIFRDGSVALFGGGGIIEIPGEHGPIQLLVEPGAISSKTKMKFEAVPLAAAVQAVGNVQPEDGGRILGGVKVKAFEGSPLSQSIDIVFPTSLNDLQLPTGVSPTNCGYGLVLARTIDGMQVYELIDRMHYENGNLVTHSLPFLGLIGGGFEDLFMLPILMTIAQVPLSVSGYVYVQKIDPQAPPNPADAKLKIDTNGKPLPTPQQQLLGGAVVTARPASLPYNLRGRLRPGSVYTVSRADGQYALLVPSSYQTGTPVASLNATHPRFPGIKGDSQPFPELSSNDRAIIGNTVTRWNVAFNIPLDALRSPPTINTYHAPQFPPVNTNAVLTVVVSDNETPPSLTLQVDSLQPSGSSVNVLTSDLTISDPLITDVSPLAKRYEYNVRSTKPLFAFFNLQASDEDGHTVPSSYAIQFGGSIQTNTNNPPISDTNDKTGPYVVAVLPSPGSKALAPGQPVVVRFNEAISKAVLTQRNPISITPVTPYYVTLSDDQLDLSIYLTQAKAAETYNVTLGSSIWDLAQNTLDQNPTERGNQSYSFEFTTAATRQIELIDFDYSGDRGAGAFVRGGYAYLLERNGSQLGRLAVFDVTSPTQPKLVGKYDMAAFPREVLSLGRYGYWTTNGDNPILRTSFTQAVERDLVAVVGGLAGQGQSSWLRIIDVTNPKDPKRVAGAVFSFNGDTVPGRLRWSPPYLAYMETGSPDRISIVNLQSLIIADSLVSNQFEYRSLPEHGIPGVDLNGDGDFVDANEKPAFPARLGVDFGGKELSIPIVDTTQSIADFVLENKGDFVGAVVGSGVVLDENGKPTATNAPPAYRTLQSGGGALPRELASFEYPDGHPRRMLSLFQYPIVLNNTEVVRDLVLVAVRDVATNATLHTNFVSVLDVTDRLAVKELSRIYIPRGDSEQNINSILQRDDGLIVVLEDSISYLLDPGLLTASSLANGAHPALLGPLSGMGGTPRSAGSTPFGLNVSASLVPPTGGSGTPTLTQTAPTLSFMRFNNATPFTPEGLPDRSQANIDALFNAGERLTFLAPGRFHENSDCSAPLITNLDSRSHYYVILQAPGGAGAKVELAVEALDWAQNPIRKKGFLFPPVHALGRDSLLSLGETPGKDDAPVRTLTAWRVSNDPASPYFNYYVSRPFVLVAEEFSASDLAIVKSQLDREVLWSGAYTRAFIDHSQKDNAVLGPFAATLELSDRSLCPGVETLALSFNADLIPSPNPGPIVGETVLPSALDSLSAHNSELVINASDIGLPGRRLSIEFTRTYRGQSLYDGVFGRGWDFNFNQRIAVARSCVPFAQRLTPADSEIAQAGDLIFHNGAGQVILFQDAGANAPTEIANDPLIQQLGWLPKASRFYLPPPGLFTPFVKFKDGRYVRLEPDGKQYWYNAAGRLTTIYDRFEKNAIQLVYNDKGELIQILDELSRAIEIGYFRAAGDSRHYRPGVDQIASQLSDLGKVARIKDYSRRDVLFEYTEDGLLKKRLGPNIETAAPGGFTGRQETQYDYSDASNPAKSAKSLIAVRGQEVGGVPVIAVNEIGKTGRDTVSQLSVGGRRLALAQSITNTAKALAAGAATSTITNTDGSVATLGFDKFGRIIQSILSDGRNHSETGAQEFYDNGLIKAVTSPEGDRTEFYYDSGNASLRSRGNMIRLKKIPGPRGGPILEAATHYNSLYNLTEGEKTDFNGVVATIALQADKKSTEHISKGGEIELFGVNEYGQLNSQTSVDRITTTSSYDDQTGFLTSKSVGNAHTRYLYTPLTGATSDPGLRGRPSEVIDPNSVVTFFQHDELDQVVSERRGEWSRLQSFDGVGNLRVRSTTVATNLVRVETFDYLPMGFLREERVKDVEVGTAKADLVTTYEPDASYRITHITYPTGEEQRFLYDGFSRLAEVDTIGSHTNFFQYDRNGNLVSVAWGSTTEQYLYDGHDRQIAIIGSNGSVQQMMLDGNGNVRTNRVVDRSGALLGEWHMEYDDLNRARTLTQLRSNGAGVSQYLYNSGERSVTYIDPLNQTAKTFLDEQGRVTRTITPGATLLFTNDFKGNVLATATVEADRTFGESYEYNNLDQNTSVTDSAGHVARFTPELDGRVVNSTDREGHATQNTYTLLSETSAFTLPNGVTRSNYYNLGRDFSRVADYKNRATEWHYDPLERMVTNTLPNGQKTVFSDFNQWGHPAKIQMPRGITVEAQFDSEGKVTNRVVRGPNNRVHQELFDYDGLRRPLRIKNDSGEWSVGYDLGGFVNAFTNKFRFNFPDAAPGFTAIIRQDANEANFRTSLTYPDNALKLTYTRDPEGRLKNMSPASADPIISTNVYAGDSRESSTTLGDGQIRIDYTYDNLRRVTSKRFIRIKDNTLLADVRYAFDNNGAIKARQYVHRGGRSEFFTYDEDYRLVRADVDVRPSASEETVRTFPGFSIPSGLPGTWMPGAFARVATYLPDDSVSSYSILNPLQLAITPMANNFASLDSFAFAHDMDGFTRNQDEVGSVTRTLLMVRPPEGGTPKLVGANLTYDDLGMLSRIDRDDGVSVYNEYNHDGYRIRRKVAGPANLCEPSDIAFVYDGFNLLEERDLSNNARLLARYYYADSGDLLLAADFVGSNGTPRRYYYLTDISASVLGVTDSEAHPLERVHYDVWGFPQIEATDTNAPAVVHVRREANGITVTFSESVLPPLPSNTDPSAVMTELNSISRMKVTSNGQPINGAWTLDDSNTAAGFSTVVRFITSADLNKSIVLEIPAGTVADEWGNGNAKATLTVNANQPTGTILFTGVTAGSTAPTILGRSSINSRFLFHGQVYDYETGLLYCRARYYDPHSGSFLQRDPAGYRDGMNQYAGFGNNPVMFRDPAGTSVFQSVTEFGRDLTAWGQEMQNHRGILYYILGTVVSEVGSAVALPGNSRDAWNTLTEQGYGGTLDALNRLHAANSLTTSAHQWVKLIQRLYSAYRLLGETVQDIRANAEIRRFQKQGFPRGTVDELVSQGLTKWEAEGFINWVKYLRKKYGGEVDAQIRSFGDKAEARRALREAGARTKAEWIKNKTFQSRVAVSINDETRFGISAERKMDVTGDLDFYYVKVNGRMLNRHEDVAEVAILNRMIGSAYQRQGGTGYPGASAHHGAHLNLPTLVGQIKNHAGAHLDQGNSEKEPGTATFTVNMNKAPEKYGAEMISHIAPGAAAFGLRANASGRVQVNMPTQGYLKGLIKQRFRLNRNFFPNGVPDDWKKEFDPGGWD